MEGRYRQDLTVYHKYFTEERDCIVCGGSGKLWGQLGPFTAVKCDCGFVWMNPYPNNEGLAKYYDDYIGRRSAETWLCEARQIQYRIDRDFLERFVNRGKVLDVGCSGGYFLDVLGDKFDRHGIEIDPEAVKCANDNYDFTVTHGRIEDYPDTEFDIITMRGVIEHFPNPAEVMDKVASLLRRGGILYIAATPDVSSFCADIYRENWNQFQPVEHLSYFSVPSLTRFLSGTFKYIAHHHPYIETPYQDMENDYKRVFEYCKHKNGISPPFWGSMMNVVFKRE